MTTKKMLTHKSDHNQQLRNKSSFEHFFFIFQEDPDKTRLWTCLSSSCADTVDGVMRYRRKHVSDILLNIFFCCCCGRKLRKIPTASQMMNHNMWTWQVVQVRSQVQNRNFQLLMMTTKFCEWNFIFTRGREMMK